MNLSYLMFAFHGFKLLNLDLGKLVIVLNFIVVNSTPAKVRGRVLAN